MHFHDRFLNEKKIEKDDFLYKKINKKNIVFLDIDGVLQPYGNKYRFNHNFEETLEYICNKYNDEIYKEMDIYDVMAAFYDWDDSALGFLKKLLYETNSFIVFHTGWRDFNSFEKLKALFKLYDLDERCLASCEKGDKKEAIFKYLEENKEKIENFIVIDDYDYTDIFGEKYVKTSNFFKYENYKTAKVSLENQKIVKDKDKYFIDFKKNYGYKLEAKISINDFANNKNFKDCETGCEIIFEKSKREVPAEYFLYLAKYIKKDLYENNKEINEIKIIENEKIVNFFNKNGIHIKGNTIYLKQKPFNFSF